MIDKHDGSCSELNRLIVEICQIELSDEKKDTNDEYVDVVQEESPVDGYNDGDIGKQVIESEINSINKVIDERDGMNRGMFDINFSVLNVQNKVERFRILLDSGASCNVVPTRSVELLALGCSDNLVT